MARHPKACTCEQCGASSGLLLDFGFQLPDCIWDQPAAERSPRNTQDFAELDERCFVRGLLPVKLDTGEEFRYGVWLEVSRATFDDARGSWNDKQRYPLLKFVAKIANAAPPWRARIVGAEVKVAVRDQQSRPFVVAARKRWLQAIIKNGWTVAGYQAAIATFR